MARSQSIRSFHSRGSSTTALLPNLISPRWTSQVAKLALSLPKGFHPECGLLYALCGSVTAREDDPMPKSIKRYDEKNITAQYDKNATELIAEAVKWEQQADAATTPESAKEYRAKAQELRNKALEALQLRKTQ
jgi:hypothetical protein